MFGDMHLVPAWFGFIFLMLLFMMRPPQRQTRRRGCQTCRIKW